MNIHHINYLHGVGGIFLVLAGVIFLVYLAYTYINKQKNKNADRNDSLEILQKRLASGEISIDEFKTIKRVLFTSTQGEI